MSDLVARLRDGAVSPYVAWMPVNVLRREAAAEIERLRLMAYQPADKHEPRCDCLHCVPF